MEEASVSTISGATQTIGLPTRAPLAGDLAPQIPDYRFVKVIGRGSFGAVWLAEETMAGVYRAIKVLHPARTRTPKPTDRPASAVPRESSDQEQSLTGEGPPVDGRVDPWALPVEDRERPPSLIDRELAGIHAYEALAEEHPHLVRILKTGLCKMPFPIPSPSQGEGMGEGRQKQSAFSDQLSASQAAATGDKAAGARILSRTPSPGIPAHEEPNKDSRSSESAAARLHTTVYYVMEIADHAGGAQPHHEMDYQPLSLATLLRQKGRLPASSPVQSLVRESRARSSLVRESFLAPNFAGIPSRVSTQQPTGLGVVECALDLLDAIEHLHKAGLQHRDIKPSNILFVNGVIKLADLGLTASDAADETVGTPGYLPPPHARLDADGGEAAALVSGERGAAVASAPRGDQVASAPRGRRGMGEAVPPPRRPRGADATPPTAGSPPERRFGPPDDLYALGKVMYEMLTGLPAASFPEWPADLDPATDPLLPRLRVLINEFCHPAANRRLSDARKARQKLADVKACPRLLRLTRRRAIVALTILAAVALGLGVAADRFWAWWTDPFRPHLARSPYDGSEVTQEAILGAIDIQLARDHLPGQSLSIQTDSRWRLIRFADIQTRLIADELAVAGCYQIVSTMNPVTGSVLDPRGEVDQLLLVLTDGKNSEVRFLYHGQPGPAPGARGRFCERFSLTSSEWLRPGAGCCVFLAYMAETTPEKAREGFEKRGRDENHTVRIAEIHFKRLQPAHLETVRESH